MATATFPLYGRYLKRINSVLNFKDNDCWHLLRSHTFHYISRSPLLCGRQKHAQIWLLRRWLRWLLPIHVSILIMLSRKQFHFVKNADLWAYGPFIALHCVGVDLLFNSHIYKLTVTQRLMRLKIDQLKMNMKCNPSPNDKNMKSNSNTFYLINWRAIVVEDWLDRLRAVRRHHVRKKCVGLVEAKATWSRWLQRPKDTLHFSLLNILKNGTSSSSQCIVMQCVLSLKIDQKESKSKNNLQSQKHKTQLKQNFTL